MKLFFPKKTCFETCPGKPYPLGATMEPSGVNFAIFSEHATKVILDFFYLGEKSPCMEVVLDPKINRTGNIWHVFLVGLSLNMCYAYRMDGKYSPQEGQYFQEEKLLVDPYAKKVYSLKDEYNIPFLVGAISIPDFDWQGDVHPNIPWQDVILYELHVRGYTKNSSSHVSFPGTYLGLIEKIPYLKSLGVNAVELLPIHEFNENENIHYNPVTKKRLKNYWGYSTRFFFIPQSTYATFNAIQDFKQFVRACHKENIEVILDVVFNHTCEGDEKGSIVHFRGIDNSNYYILTSDQHHANYSGCGNTVQCQHPIVQNFILDCLHYWYCEMHVDGFRFDLASILCRDEKGNLLSNPSLIKRIAQDPILKNCKLIAEPWDAGGAYQVGSFPHYGRWAEWNGYYRDHVRSFIKGDCNVATDFAKCIVGSPSLYNEKQRPLFHTINFITCHDGFTLADLVSYNEPHNFLNGEDNRDGCKNNYSWNCGEEGFTKDSKILALRKQQQKNYIAVLLLSWGVPMLLAGDEFGRSQDGNNNAYCQDNKISWINWSLLKSNEELFHFTKCMIALRKRYSLLHPKDSNQYKITYHGVNLNSPDMSYNSHSLAIELESDSYCLYIAINAFWEKLVFELPDKKEWKCLVDTSQVSPQDIVEEENAKIITESQYTVKSRSLIILISYKILDVKK